MVTAGTAAYAADFVAARYGSYAEINGNTATVTKTEQDSKGAFAGAYLQGGSRVVTGVVNVYGQKKSVNLVVAATGVEACIDNGLFPATCSPKNVIENPR